MEPDGLDVSLGKYSEVVADAVAQAGQHNVVQRIWNKDASLWKSDAAHQKIIRNSLGWLNVASEIRVVSDELIAFADQIRGPAGFKHVMLCGMGGSSLCPEVIRQTFGQQPGYPNLLVSGFNRPGRHGLVRETDRHRSLSFRHCLEIRHHYRAAGFLQVLVRAGRATNAKPRRIFRRYHRPGHSNGGNGDRR